jgi:osmoprotectant transport system substrate-binding protein
MQALGFRLDRSEVKQMDPGLVYTALKNSTLRRPDRLGWPHQGLRPAAAGGRQGLLRRLQGDPVVRQDILEKNPKLAAQLNELAAKIDTATMTELNKRVDRPGTSGQGGSRLPQASRPDLRRTP